MANDGCWLWQARKTKLGYGRFSIGGKERLAHRLVYSLLVGEPKLTLDHLCRVPRCVNPEHLEDVSHRDNVLRGVGMAAKYAARGACKNGHSFTPENTRLKKGVRICRACRRESGRVRFPVGKKGGRNGRAVITEMDVVAIRADTRPQAVIGAEYGINQTTVSAIKRRAKWGHVP